MPRKSNKEIGEAWEEEVKDFLNEELCFENVDGGSNFRPAGHQVNVVGGNKFTSKNQFDNALQHLELFRNSEFHGMLTEEERQVIKRPDQKRIADSQLKIFNSVIQNKLSQDD